MGEELGIVLTPPVPGFIRVSEPLSILRILGLIILGSLSVIANGEFSQIMQLVITGEERSLKIPPPYEEAEFPIIVQLVIFGEGKLYSGAGTELSYPEQLIPAPERAEFRAMMQLVIVQLVANPVIGQVQ